MQNLFYVINIVNRKIIKNTTRKVFNKISSVLVKGSVGY